MVYLAACADAEPFWIVVLVGAAALYVLVLWRAFSGLGWKARLGAGILFLATLALGYGALEVTGNAAWGVIAGGLVGVLFGLLSDEAGPLRLALVGGLGGITVVAAFFWIVFMGIATGELCLD